MILRDKPEITSRLQTGNKATTRARDEAKRAPVTPIVKSRRTPCFASANPNHENRQIIHGQFLRRAADFFVPPQREEARNSAGSASLPASRRRLSLALRIPIPLSFSSQLIAIWFLCAASPGQIADGQETARLDRKRLGPGKRGVHGVDLRVEDDEVGFR